MSENSAVGRDQRNHQKGGVSTDAAGPTQTAAAKARTRDAAVAIDKDFAFVVIE